MKWKKIIGKEINGFIIVDSQRVVTKCGKDVPRVILRCTRCGKTFDRSQSIDIYHAKCKCMVKRKKNTTGAKHPRHYIKRFGETKTLSEWCRIEGVKLSVVRNRINQGVPEDVLFDKCLKHRCVQCGYDFYSPKATANFCCNNCKIRHQKKKGATSQINPFDVYCDVCGTLFTTTNERSRLCSDKCRYRAAKNERNGRLLHLARCGSYDPSVTLEAVFDKFGGICCECSKRLELVGDFRRPDYPTIDHINPLSKGGTHEWENVQLLCRKCNGVKGDR